MTRTVRRQYVTADVFTNRVFGGNPLAVVLEAEGLSTREMQAIASEFNYSETTFVLPPRDPSNTARVRIFTPRAEVPFAGHPNVGTAFVLGRRGAAEPAGGEVRFVFEEDAGLVPVALLREEGTVVGAELTAPQPLTRRAHVPAAQVAASLGLSASDVRTDRHAPQVISVGLPFLVAELATREALRAATPNLTAFADVLPPVGTDALYIYTRDAGRSDIPGDLSARMFAPLGGVPEDPATGSATAAAAAFLADLSPDADLELVLNVVQGEDMGRPSLLRARVVKRQGVLRGVHVGGRCVEVMAGALQLPATTA